MLSTNSSILYIENTGMIRERDERDLSKYSDVRNYAFLFPSIFENRDGIHNHSAIGTVKEREFSSAMGSSFGETFVFNRIWIYPTLFDLGFIVEDSTHDIRFWNSFLYRSAVVSTYSVDLGSGVDLDISLPMHFNPFSDKDIVLVVYGIGPATQKTTYGITFDGSNFDVLVTGLRTIIFDYFPNYGDAVNFKYSFHSIVATTKRLVEQRRALSNESWVEFSGSFHARKRREQKLFNMLSFAKDRIISVPVYMEVLRPLSIGELSLIVKDNLKECYFAHKKEMEFVLLTDHKDTIEMKKISAVNFDTGEIEFDIPIEKNFDVTTCHVYPVVNSMLKSVSIQEETDEFSIWKIDFQEFKGNG